MANEEVLELQIRDNAADAASALNNLADTLTKVKEAIGKGLHLKGTASALETLKNAVSNGLSDESVSRWERLSDALERIKAIGGIKVLGVNNVAKQLSIADSLQDAKSQADNTMNGIVDSVDRGMETVESRTNTSANSIKQSFADLKSKISKVWSEIKGVKNETNKTGVGRFFDELGKSVGTVREKLRGLAGDFGRIVKYRIIRSIIKQITAAFSEGVENVYWYSKAIGGDFATSMDDAATALLQFKNSIGAAVAPLIQMMIPALQQVIDFLITGINYLNQFLALWNGQATWTKAVKQSANAFDDTKKAAKGAASAIKELLADWDELNIIQSETGGGSGTPSKMEDALHMFEEETEFSKFLKDNFEKVKNIVKDIGIALLAWKMSSMFTGWLSSLSSLALAGMVVKLTLDIVTLMDNQYLETGDAGWLIGNVLTSALGSLCTEEIINKVLGRGMGLVSAGITLAITAGVDFAVSDDAKDEARKKTLQLIAGIKAAISSALISIGLKMMGWGLFSSLFGGVILAGLTIAITYSAEITAKNVQTAKEAAEKAFAESGTGGINPQEYITELQKKLDELTEGEGLVLNTFVDVPELSSKLSDAVEELKGMFPVINGEEALTEDDANKFKTAWGIIMETMDSMNSKTYDTILAGLNSSLKSANEELQANIDALRVSFIQLEKNLDEQSAQMYKDLQDIVDKIASGTATQEDIEKYKSIWTSLAIATDTSLEGINSVITKAKRFDFGSDNALETATQFIQDLGVESAKATSKIDEALDDELKSLEYKRSRTQTLFDNEYISKETYDNAMAMYDEISAALNEAAKEKKNEVSNSLQEAYNILFNQALSKSDGSASYWRNIILPLVKNIKEAGGMLSDEMMDALRGSVSGEAINIWGQFITPSAATISGLKNMNSDEIVEVIKANVKASTDKLKNTSMPDYVVNIMDLFGLTGFDLMTDEMKEDLHNSLVDILGSDKADEVLKGLGIDIPSKLEVPELDNKELKESTEDSASAVEGMTKRIKKAFSELDGLSFSFVTGSEVLSGVVKTIIPNVALAANGGMFGTGQMFVAREAGPELIGTMGNKSAVVNNDQIVQGITGGVERGNENLESKMSNIETMLSRILQKEFVAKAVPSSSWGNHNAQSKVAYDRVTG